MSTPAPVATTTRGATVGKRGFGVRAWGIRHAQTFFYALGLMVRRPASSLMTAAVIGIALAMPAGLHVLLTNAKAVTSGWDGATRVSLFLHRSTADREAQALATRLRQLPDIIEVTYISREQALDEFRTLSGFGEALDALVENPLPAVLVVQPRVGGAGPEMMTALLERLRGQPEVDIAQLDMQWIKRLYALMDIVERGVWVLASLLALAVLLVVGNTIRLAIQNRRDEIVVMKLIGGTDAFIRRPFLYTGLWYGIFGGIIAWALVTTALLFLHEPVQQLAGLYQSGFRLQLLDLSGTGALLGSGVVLGLAGSWLAVGRHLREIEPT